MPDLDLVVLGATGFTGRQAISVFRAHPDAAGLRLGVAGRDAARLAQVADGLPAQVVDTADADAVDRLAASTRVLVTTVGPYARYGDLVVDACARHGTDYVDITGESPWMRRVIDRLDEPARRSGARILPACGFDSIPSDLGVWMMSQALRERHQQGTAEVRSTFRMKGGLNGGTIASAMAMAESEDARAFTDPLILVPDPLRGPFDLAATRAASRADLQPHYDADFQTWIGPFVMAAVNGAVVRRSHALLSAKKQGYGDRFVYHEGASAKNAAWAWGLAGGLGLMAVGGRMSLTRAAIQRFATQPGQGPSEAEMDGGWFRTELLGIGDGGARVRGRIVSPGDPGNRSTVRMMCAAALCLRLDAVPREGGVLTPASALGGALIERLRRDGMTWELDPA